MEKLKNGWFQGDPTKDGEYLRAFDEWDDEEDAERFSYRNGKWLKGELEWICYGGVWNPLENENPS